MRKTIIFSIFLLATICLRGQSPDTTCLGEAGTIQWRVYSDIRGLKISDMTAASSYPQSPDIIKYLNVLETPKNYYKYFGAVMEGFIQAPETGYYTFNLTADDYAILKFSLGGAGSPLDTIAFIDGYTQFDQHNKYASQTSDSLYLESGRFYYFWFIYKEHLGYDHGTIYWNRPSMPDTAEWEVIHGDFLFDNACIENCPPAGTPCDDGDPSTTNDKADGHCHCYGTPIEPSPCAGAFGQVNALYFDSIYSRKIKDLLISESFPAQPSRSETLHELKGPLERNDNYGTRIRAWLYPPESGFYQFNVTGDYQVFLYLGYSDTLSYDNMEIARVDAHTYETDFDDEESQTSDSIWLIQGRLYYLEVLHQDNWGSEDFAVHWKTPFQKERIWQVIDGSFLREYTCLTACIPEGTTCDDGNTQTFDDHYNDQCICVGTPCIDEDCSNARDYEPVASCGDQGSHSTHPADSWSSCLPRQSPNPLRGLSHWIEYDLGDIYLLDNLYIWNYNATQATDQGFRLVAVDYSLDGSFWFEAGVFTWDAASGQPDYSGFDWDALRGIGARYLLFTAIANYGALCSGLSEVQFDVYPCPPVGTDCNDNDPNTNNDIYTQMCECRGTPIPQNTCEPRDTLISGTIALGRHNAGSTLIADGKLAPGSKTVLVAGESIILKPGFHAPPNSELLATILGCNTSPTNDSIQEEPNIVANMIGETHTTDEQLEKLGRLYLRVQPNPALDKSSVAFNLPSAGAYSLAIRTVSGQLVQTLSKDTFLPEGNYQKDIAVQRLAAGVYFVHFTFAGETITERLIVLRP